MAKTHTKEFLDEVKATILAEKEKLEQDLGHIAHKNPKKEGDYDSDFPNFGDDPAENAAEVAEYDTNLRIEETLEKKLRDVKKTLERIESGDYGICKYCKNAIEEGRLKARPTSGSCVTCKKTLTQEA